MSLFQQVIKIYRLADTIIDVITSKLKCTNIVEFCLQQVLTCLCQTLEAVDGVESDFLKRTQSRLASLGNTI